jgi:hypothetical protein
MTVSQFLGFLALLVVALALPQAALSQNHGPDLERPADVEAWPTVGTTVRLDSQHGQTPSQMRQVLMAPADYAHFRRSGAYLDGTTFAVLFYPVALDNAHQPPLYHAQAEQAFAMEVIDRGHPDGRRFYMFAPGATRASPLAAGNECAICHNAQGSVDGTFAHLYPALARRAD